MPDSPDSATRQPKKVRAEVKALAVMLGLVVSLGFMEIVLRVTACTTPIGSPCIGGVLGIPVMELLPHRPSREQLEAAWTYQSKAPFIGLDPDLGWIAIDADPVNDVNKQGMHASRDRVYTKAIPRGKKRILAVGDSVIWATRVLLEETWPAVIEDLRPDIEVINYGVPGYGPSQAFLRWRRDAKEFEADVTVFGIWPDNLFRLLSTNRYYLTLGELPREKPRFILRDGELEVVNFPVRNREQMISDLSSKTLAEPNYEFWIEQDDLEFKPWYYLRTLRVLATVLDRWQRRNLHADLYSGKINIANELAVAISKKFAEEATALGSIPLIVVLPAPDLIFRWREKDSMPMTRQLREAGLEVLDLMPVFANAAEELGGDQNPLFTHAHLSQIGNRIFAEELIRVTEELLTKAAR